MGESSAPSQSGRQTEGEQGLLSAVDVEEAEVKGGSLEGVEKMQKKKRRMKKNVHL